MAAAFTALHEQGGWQAWLYELICIYKQLFFQKASWQALGSRIPQISAMQTEAIQNLTDTFEGHAQHTDSGVEYWLARDIQHLLGYSEWRNFGQVINKAKTACDVSEHRVNDHFVDVNKMVQLGSGSEREVDDIMLTRYACYLIAQNGDPRKSEIAFAQTYFALQTRKAELIAERLLQAE